MAALGERAVVLGASMGGLLAARVLADFYETVTVVERDALPDEPANRRGVPQGRHVHALLPRGGQILDGLFPGILNDLVVGGAPVLDDGDLSKLYLSYSGHKLLRSGKVPVDDDATAMHMPSRPFLESHVRRRIAALPNVTILAAHDVTELTATTDRDRVTGVRVVNHEGGAQHELTADVVMDAMGRGAHTPAFLEGLGYGRPVEDHIVMRTTYVSQHAADPPGTVEEKLALISPAPGRPTGMFLTGYEHDNWIFTVFGMVGHEPPRELAGMLAFARRVCACASAGGGAGRRTDRAGGATPHAVQPVAALRQDAAVPGRPARLRRRYLQLQSDLRAGNVGGGVGRCGTAGDVAARCHEPAPAVLSCRGEGDRCGLADRGWFRLGFPRGGRATDDVRCGSATGFVEWVLTACESDMPGRRPVLQGHRSCRSARAPAQSAFHRQGREGQSASSAT